MVQGVVTATTVRMHVRSGRSLQQSTGGAGCSCRSASAGPALDSAASTVSPPAPASCRLQLCHRARAGLCEAAAEPCRFVAWDCAGLERPIGATELAHHAGIDLGRLMGRVEIIRPRDMRLVKLLGYGSIGEVGLRRLVVSAASELGATCSG